MFRTEKVQIEIDASTQTAVRQIAKLQQEYDNLRPKVDDARKAVDKASNALEKFSKADRNPSNQKWKDAYDKYYQAEKAYRDLKESSDKYNLSIERQVKELGLAGLSNKELNKYLTEQTRLLNSARRGTDEYADSLEKLKKAKAEKSIRTTDIVGEKSLMENMKGGFLPALIGGVAGGAVAMAGEVLGSVMGSIGDKIDKIISKSDKMTDLASAIHGTTEEAKQLNTAIGIIDTRIDMKTRRDIATEAGKLDVPTNQIVSYTEAMSEAVLVMESDFPDGAGKMTEVFTKIKGLYKDTKDLDYPTSVKNIGSALKGLADDGTATAKWSSEFLLRLGALDEGVRPTITQLLGLGAALEESGLTDEIAASGVQNVLSKAYKNTEGFAKFFGQSKKDFEAFINLNPNEFLFKFAERLKPLSSTQKMQALQALGVDSQEAAKVLGVLINKTDEVAEKQAKANSFFIEGSRLTELYATKNDNLAGKVERAGNKIAAAFSNSAIADWLGSFVGGLADAANRMFDTTSKIEQLTKKFNEQESTVNKLDKSISPLIDRYEFLNTKTIKSQSEHRELNGIISTLANVLPQSAIQFNKYGEAIGISTEKARDFIKVQKAMLKAQNAELITSLEKDLRSSQEKMLKTQRLSQGSFVKGRDRKEVFRRSNYTINDILSFKNLDLSQSEFAQQNEDLKALKLTIEETTDALKGLKGENIEIPKVNISAISKPPVEFDANDLAKDKKGGKSKAEKAAEKAKEEAKKLAEAQINATAKLNSEILSMQIERISNETDKKEAQIVEQYNKEIDAHLKSLKDKEINQAQYDTWIIERNLTLDNALAENQKQADDKAKEEAKKVFIKTATEKINAAKKLAEKELGIAKQKNDLEGQYQLEAKTLLLDTELASLSATDAEKLIIEKDYQDKLLLLKEEYRLKGKGKSDKDIEDDEAKRKAARKKLYNEISQGIQIASSLTSELFNFEKEAINNQQVQEDKRFNQKITNLENQKNQGIISEEQYNTQKTKFEKEHDDRSRELKKKAFEADKKARIAQIIMATAQAVIQALATGGIFGTVGAIAAGITGAAQLAIALSQEPPEFAEGDFTDNPKSFSSKKPTKLAKLAWVNEYGPEFINNNTAVNSPDFPMMLPLLRKMNRGEIIMPDLKAMFMPQTMQAYAQGDYTGRQISPQGNVSTQVNNNQSQDFDLKRLTLALETFNNNCEKGTFAKVFFAHKDIKDLEILKTQTQALENRASAKNGNTTF